MNLEEKKQIYLDRFPAIIGKRMSEQYEETDLDFNSLTEYVLISGFNYWSYTEEGVDFWSDIHNLYYQKEPIEHKQILDIFHKHNIKP